MTENTAIAHASAAATIQPLLLFDSNRRARAGRSEGVSSALADS
jgi:hypothetical protein